MSESGDLSSAARRVYRFGDFELRSHPLSLRRSGTETEVSSQPLRLLLLLVENNGEVVSHDNIRGLLWPDQNVDVTGRLHACIRHIRKALGDDNGEPLYIETVPRQGYRFVAEVTVEPQSNDGGAELGGQPRSLKVAAVAATLVAAIALGALLAGSDEKPASAPAAASGPAIDNAFAEGRSLLADGSPAAIRDAVRIFESAITASPDFAPLQASLAEAWYRLGSGDSARPYALRATELDPTYARGLLWRGRIAGFVDYRWNDATRDLEQALTLTPDEPELLLALAEIHLVNGRRENSVQLIEKFGAADPGNASLLIEAGRLNRLQRRYDAADESCWQAVELEPEMPGGHECLYRLALVQKDLDTALQHAADIAALLAGDAAGFTVPDSADLRDALSEFERWRLERLQQAGTLEPVQAAYSHIVMQQYDEAFFLLRQAHTERSPHLPLAMLDLIFVGLFHQSAFVELRREMGLSEQVFEN